MSQIISIEGNIGSGKTTFLSYMREYYRDNPNIIFLREPVDEWESIKDYKTGQSMLEKFYLNQEKYSFSFQMMAFISRLSLLKETVKQNPNAIIITERCLYTDKYVFAKMLYDMGKIEDINYQIYNKWFEEFSSDYPITKIIYIKSSPDICQKRIKIRNRISEDTISLDYLTECSDYHNDMIEIFYRQYNTDIKILDGNIDIFRLHVEGDIKIIYDWIKLCEIK
jgi:deoxyadenosine/deoxycytidine kinase